VVVLENHQLSALLQNISPSSVWNKERRNRKKKKEKKEEEGFI